MVSTTGALERELRKVDDDFVICKYIDKDGIEHELVIDSIGTHKVHGDRNNQVCCCLNLRDGGNGCIKK